MKKGDKSLWWLGGFSSGTYGWEKSGQGKVMSKYEVKKRGLFTWWMPETKHDSGEISCPKQYGGCGRRHSFAVNELLGELDFDLSWESNKGEFWCDKFADWLQEEAEQEWKENLREDYLKIIGEVEESEEAEQEKRTQREKVKAGVRIDERQYDKEFGRYLPVGYREGKQEFFICSSCGKDLRGAGKTGKSKNRNNPVFWGLDTPEKVLCGKCLEQRKGEMPALRKKKFNWYLKTERFE